MIKYYIYNEVTDVPGHNYVCTLENKCVAEMTLKLYSKKYNNKSVNFFLVVSENEPSKPDMIRVLGFPYGKPEISWVEKSRST